MANLENLHFGSKYCAFAWLGAAVVVTVTGVADAQPVLRQQQDQRGDFVLIGNTLAQDCAPGIPLPVVGTVNGCGTSVIDSGGDVYWRSDSPVLGSAEANTSLAANAARTTALLALPPGAVVTYARLYWAAKTDSGMADTSASLEREGGFVQAIAADDTWLVSDGGDFYQASADVTSLVQAQGSGTYRVSGVDAIDLVNTDDSVVFAGWSMVVFYQLDAAPFRNLTLFDGFDRVSNGNDQVANLSGFVVPAAGFDAKLGVLTYEGDDVATGDELRFGVQPLTAADRLSDAQNPSTNFFNGSRSTLGVPVSVVGDLPQLAGTPGSMSGLDIDIVDVTSSLTAGQTAVSIRASSSGDIFFLGGFVTSISTLKPDFTSSNKVAFDVNGGELVVGDILRYEVTVTNSGDDASVDTRLTDVLPSGVAYVPDTLAIVSGPNAGVVTDPLDSDVGEVVGDVVAVRLGTGANGTIGGMLGIDETTVVSFDVVVEAIGSLSNQASVNASGELGAPLETTPTDADPGQRGQQSTDSIVHECSADGGCSGRAAVCDLATVPHVCIGCLDNSDCRDSLAVCDVAVGRCGPCQVDRQCEDAKLVCDDGACVPMGGGGAGGSGGDGTGGVGGGGPSGGAGGIVGGMGGVAPDSFGRYEGSGFRCSVGGASDDSSNAALSVIGVLLLTLRRRKR